MADRSAITAVAFAEPGDMVLLGAVGLETLNLKIDLGRKELVPAGPVPAAVGFIREYMSSRFPELPAEWAR